MKSKRIAENRKNQFQFVVICNGMIAFGKGLLCLICFTALGWGQNSLNAQVQENGQPADTAIERIGDVTLTAYRATELRKTSLNVSVLKVEEMRKSGNFNLTDMMAKIPGVTMLSTGVAIAKPVIRGSFGNRVVVLLNGLKFDNQQWQEEHGLGLTDLGIGTVEIVKGPLSVLFGSEAIGGVVNIIDEVPAKGIKSYSAMLKSNSNTAGGTLQLGFLKNAGHRWQTFHLGVENNADYSDGAGNRVLNSRFDGYAAKFSAGFKKANWESVNAFSSSFNRFGFIFPDVYSLITPDARWCRNLNTNPNHMVLLNIASSRNVIQLKNRGNLNVNVGVQSNERMENEGGGQISLNMHLLTFQYLIKYEKRLTNRTDATLSHLTVLENNKNYGGRKIVPDARMGESNISAHFSHLLSKRLQSEMGFGVGVKSITTLYTPSVNSEEKMIKPFQKTLPYYNGLLGLNMNSPHGFYGKASISSGVRIPNLAELSSNGLHEGVFTFEIGNPKFKNEQVVAANLILGIKQNGLDAFFSPFYNRYFNYIYLAPTTDKWLGMYPIYRYQQQNATQFGGEVGINYLIRNRTKLGLMASAMNSKTADGNYTPYIPANKISPSITWMFGNDDALTQGSAVAHRPKKYQATASVDFVSQQQKTALGEVGSKAYQLFNLGLQGNFVARNGGRFNLSLQGNNLFNERYIDNLSRFKAFGLMNIGRNFVILLKWNINEKA
jgi:iron complex outermembrane receptor protein